MNFVMSLSLDEFRCKLINKVLFAESQEEVMRFSIAAMKGLEHHQVNPHIVIRFVDKIISELESFSPMDKNAQQWSNISMAKMQFWRIKQQLSASVG
jgi:hypothetical protein